jgi:L-ascorbate metabolism protein UlaG (beta-lactamase superfamily)
MIRRFLKRAGLSLLAVLALTVLIVLPQAWEGLGHRATGARRARMEKSPQWKDGAFENPEPIVNHVEMISGFFNVSPDATPKTPVDAQKVDPAFLAVPPATGLRITWMGHSTTLIELDGHRVLTDPVWSDRVGPLTWIGPTRYFPPLIALDALGKLDAVLISHDHYDHLDQRTVVALKNQTDKFIVPLGVGAHLEYWGIPLEKIVEVDWWEHVKVGGLDVVSTPVRHASGRQVFDKDATLWSSYALLGPAHRVYYSGDTGLFTAMQDIGERFGPFDVTMIEVGQYHRGWPDWHIGPEQAVTAHEMLRGKVFFPIHWGLFTLAYHAWTEPIERSVLAAKSQSATIVTPRPGQSVEPEVATAFARWWPSLQFDDATAHAIVSGNVVFRAPGGGPTGAPAK